MRPLTSGYHSTRRRIFKLVRGLFSPAGIGWLSFVAGCATSVAQCLRFLYPNVTDDSGALLNAGRPEDYREGEVSTRWKDKYGVWIVRQGGKIFALRAVCTHLGCVPVWVASEQIFKCPCHGSGFTIEGINFEGPAPRPLERLKITLTPDGYLLVDTRTALRKERGEWTEEKGAWVTVS